MNVAVLGATGMLGHRVALDLARCGHNVVAYGRKSCPEKLISYFKESNVEVSYGFNAEDSSSWARLAEFKPDIVINCIGIIKQVEASRNHITSISINALFPHSLVDYVSKWSGRVIHFSTDCVFDGVKGNYIESDIPNANDLYGRSKLLGEVTYSPHCLTLRTSIIGREVVPKGSLIDWFLSQEGGRIKGFNKAIYTGFPTHSVSKFIQEHVIGRDQWGLFHLASEKISKYELLRRVDEIYNSHIEIEIDNDFVMDRSLISEKLEREFNYRAPSWDELIEDIDVDRDLYEV